MNFAIIPVRQASTRFPNKPIAKILGHPMVWWVYRAVVEHPFLDGVCMAYPVNDAGIRLYCDTYKLPSVRTYGDCPTGSDRVYEATRRLGLKRGIVVDVQGDEPLITHSHINTVLRLFDDPKIQVATVVRKATEDEWDDPNAVKVRFNGTMNCFSFDRGKGEYVNVGIMAYRLGALAEFARAGQTKKERDVGVEAQRFLDIGTPVYCQVCDVRTVGVDRPEDIQKVETILKGRGHGKRGTNNTGGETAG